MHARHPTGHGAELGCHSGRLRIVKVRGEARKKSENFAQNRPGLNPGMLRAVRRMNRATCARGERMGEATGAKKDEPLQRPAPFHCQAATRPRSALDV
jgi:hypothetical protein